MPDSFSTNENGYEYTIEDGGITTTVYFDDTFEIIGEAISDPDTNVSFSEVITEDADAGTYTVSGTNNTSQTNKSYTYTYNSADDSLVSGEETIDGVVYQYAADGSLSSKSWDTDSLGSALTGDDLSGLPSSLIVVGGDTYGYLESLGDTEQTTYFDGSGTILGYKTVSTYSDGEYSGTSTVFSDPDWNWIGNTWSDSIDGDVVGSGSNYRTTITDDNDTPDDADDDTTSIQESGNSTFGEEEYTYEFNYAENDDGTLGDFIGGFEIVNGVKTTFGPGWEIIGSTLADPSAMAAEGSGYTAVSDHPVFTDAAYSTEETYDWGGSEVTYYDVDGAVLGYANVSTWDNADGEVEGTNIGYSDAEYNWLGGSWSDSYGSGSNTVEVRTNDSVDWWKSCST